MKLHYAIVVTGGIGSGKSTICAILKLKGFSIIDTDIISKDILNKSQDYIKKTFGADYIKANMIDRKKLGELVFNNKDKLTLLEKFLHPKIKEIVYERAKDLEKFSAPYFIDIPLFFETNRYINAQKVLLVHIPKDLQIKRIQKRDNLNIEQIHSRLNNQMSNERKMALSDYFIDNSNSINDLSDKIDIVCEKIKNDMGNTA